MVKQFIFFLAISFNAALAFYPATLETQDLLLRRPTIEDSLAIAHIALDPMVTQRTAMFPALTTVEDVTGFVEKFLTCATPRYPISWVMVEKETNQVVGLVVYCMFNEYHQRGELAYAINSQWWGKGYATQACRAIIEFSFTQSLTRIAATVDPENLASERVLQKIGMQCEGTMRSYYVVNGQPSDRKMYAIINTVQTGQA